MVGQQGKESLFLLYNRRSMTMSRTAPEKPSQGGMRQLAYLQKTSDFLNSSATLHGQNTILQQVSTARDSRKFDTTTVTLDLVMPAGGRVMYGMLGTVRI